MSEAGAQRIPAADKHKNTNRMKYDIEEELRRRILVLDGGLGTMVQSFSLGEEDFRGEEFAGWDRELKGCNDLLAMTRPEVMAGIHRMYLEAGADIVTTDSFNANRISLADYGLSDRAYDMSFAAARLARSVADEYAASHGEGYRFVGGSVGPTNKSSSIATDMSDTSLRETDFGALVAAYRPQIEGLVDGGADLLLIETCFDTLNCKAAVFAATEAFAVRGRRIPIMISGTLTNSGRTLSGQTVEAFYASVAHARPLAVGFNCSFGARQLLPYVKRLADVSEYPVSAYPNAGLPNLSGGYDESPQTMASHMEEYMRQGLVNIVGGCCGTTPEHIRCIASLARRYSPREVPVHKKRYTVLSGLEPLRVDENTGFVSIGERTNVAGSAKFARLIREGHFEEALSVARSQIEGGAQLIDVCFDDGMIDGPEAMRRFLNMVAAEPDIARVPVMIDSSSWETLEAGLRCVQGKSIVNSISLKEGEKEFLRRADLIRRYGAAAVVMLFDERGQADTYQRKIEVASRAYGLLTENGFAAEDIIFDPNVLAVATGMPEHDRYGRDFIDAAAWIRTNLPGVGISGGVSNLSFAFRGIDSVRRAMHAVFMYHARRAGMNFGIVNPSMVDMYEDIEPQLLELAEDVVLARREDAAERLAAYAESARGGKNGHAQKEHAASDAWRSGRVSERIRHAMIRGVDEYIERDALEAVSGGLSPLEVIDRCFMPAMEHVGVLFGEGKMFLPQVVKTARVMKKGVGALVPLIEGSSAGVSSSKGKVLVATVKGDVHDIGKNIVSVVMSCNGYSVRDLGVMVESDDIVDAAIEWGADVIGLSALITPSLDEMIKVVRELERCGVTIPVIVGGATTSPVHTAVKIAPEYSGVVVHSRDASENVSLLGKLLGSRSDEFIRDIKRRQEALRQTYYAVQEGHSLIGYAEASARRHIKVYDHMRIPRRVGIVRLDNYTPGDVARYIDWDSFVRSWGMKKHCGDPSCACDRNAEERRLLDDGAAMLERIGREGLLRLDGVVGIFPAFSRGCDIVVRRGADEVVLPQLRVQTAGLPENRSLADYLMPSDVPVEDYICAFALSAGFGLDELTARFRAAGDDYNAIMVKLLADRLTEAFAEAVHSATRREWWGFEDGPEPSVADILACRYDGARMAFGYPSVPDHSLKREVFDLLEVEKTTGMKLTENYMIDPGESLCGLIFSDPDLKYFDVGRIDEEQLADYAARRGVSIEQARAMLPRNLK